jgi:hypothetical protein
MGALHYHEGKGPEWNEGKGPEWNEGKGPEWNEGKGPTIRQGLAPLYIIGVGQTDISLSLPNNIIIGPILYAGGRGH